MKSLEILLGEDYQEDKILSIFDKLEKDYGLIPRMEADDEYLNKEAQLLYQIFGNKEFIEKSQKFAKDRALKEIDRETYQAMEALVHNLNTMHIVQEHRYPLAP